MEELHAFHLVAHFVPQTSSHTAHEMVVVARTESDARKVAAEHSCQEGRKVWEKEHEGSTGTSCVYIGPTHLSRGLVVRMTEYDARIK